MMWWQTVHVTVKCCVTSKASNMVWTLRINITRCCVAAWCCSSPYCWPHCSNTPGDALLNPWTSSVKSSPCPIRIWFLWTPSKLLEEAAVLPMNINWRMWCIHGLLPGWKKILSKGIQKLVHVEKWCSHEFYIVLLLFITALQILSE